MFRLQLKKTMKDVLMLLAGYHQLVITMKIYDKFSYVFQIESTCNDIGTFGIQGKDIRRYLEGISSSAISRIFKQLCLQGIITNIGIGIFSAQKLCHFTLKIIYKWPEIICEKIGMHGITFILIILATLFMSLKIFP